MNLKLPLLAVGLFLGGLIGFLWAIEQFMHGSVPIYFEERRVLVRFTLLACLGGIVFGIILVYLLLVGKIGEPAAS